MYKKIESYIPTKPRELLSRKGILFSLLFFLLCFGFLYGIRTSLAHMRSGDEPHYLLMNYSLEKDHDLNLKNNYQNQDYLRYYPAHLEPHVSPLNIEDESSGWYSFHGFGLSLFLLPGFLIDDGMGPVITMLFIASGVLFLTWIWCLKVTNHPLASLLATISLVGCMFFSGLAGYIYPDMLSAGLLLVALMILCFYRERVWGQVVFGLVLGTIVLVHAKSLTLVLPLLSLMVYLTYKEHKKLPWIVLVSGFPFALVFFITLAHWFNTLNPAGIYPTYLGMISPLKSIPASLFGAQRGLFVYNPVLLLTLSGIVIWYKQSKQTLYYALLIIFPTYLTTMLFSEWWGGYSPVGRYLIDLLPVLMPSLAFVFVACRRKIFALIAAGLVVISFAITLLTVYIRSGYPRELYRSEFFIIIEQRTGYAIDRLLPYYSLENSNLTGQLALLKVFTWIGVMAIFVYLGFILARTYKRIPS